MVIHVALIGCYWLYRVLPVAKGGILIHTHIALAFIYSCLVCKQSLCQTQNLSNNIFRMMVHLK